MQILPIKYNTKNYNNVNSQQTKISSVSFMAGKQNLIPVDTASFKTETAKKIYSKIQQYLKFIGSEGSIRNVKIMTEKGFVEPINMPDRDILLSVNKDLKKTKISIAELAQDGKNQKYSVFEGIFDKNGQMTTGYLDGGELQFERSKPNIRRIYNEQNTYMPVGQNDKDWDCLGMKIRSPLRAEDSEYGIYEIFIELARLNTSIFK